MVHHYTKLHIFQNQEKINKEKEVRATITGLSDGLFKVLLKDQLRILKFRELLEQNVRNLFNSSVYL